MTKVNPIKAKRQTWIVCILMHFMCGGLFAQNGLSFRADYSLDKAIQVAKIENKNIFIDTYTPWCGPCKKMDFQFMDNNLGSYMNSKYINIKINMDSEYGPAIKNRYDVFFVPTLLILDKFGNVKYASEGAITSDELLALAVHFHNEIYNPQLVSNDFKLSKDTPLSTQHITYDTPKQTNTGSSAIKSANPTKEQEIKNNPKNDSVVSILGTEKSAINSPSDSYSKILNKETVSSSAVKNVEEASKEKILYIQNENNRDPEFLYNLTYLKLQLQDGTHWIAAEDYLKTQKDWSTKKNMKFIYDFVRRPGTPMFEHIINNRVNYEILFGKENVDRSLAIMINMRLSQGLPRPDEKEVRMLYNIIDEEVAEQATYTYLLERFELEKNYEAYVPLALNYIEKIDADDYSVLNKIAIYYESSTTNLNVSDLIKMVHHAIDVQGGTYYLLYDTLAALYFKKGKKKEALESIDKAISLAKNQGVDIKKIQQLKLMILDL